jgi:hypothetical protein
VNVHVLVVISAENKIDNLKIETGVVVGEEMGPPEFSPRYLFDDRPDDPRDFLSMFIDVSYVTPIWKRMRRFSSVL